MARKPSEELERLLRGEQRWEATTEAVASWARIEIWHAACEIAPMHTPAQRQQALNKIPKMHHDKIMQEVRRIWEYNASTTNR